MALKLFPPILDSKLPAFIEDTINIPFKMNRTVNITDITGMSLIIKTATTGKVVGTIQTNELPKLDLEFESMVTNPGVTEGKYIATFTCPADLNLQVGQYYKVQLAYLSGIGTEQTVGYYSSIGIIKKTARPVLEILGIENDSFGIYTYTGKYIQTMDISEKIYSYKFDLYDDEILIDTSGVKLHNSLNDISSAETTDVWTTNVELSSDKNYLLKYSIKTINGLNISKTENITFTDSIDIIAPIELETINNFSDGSIEVYLKSKDVLKTVISGNFVLTRSSSINNFSTWEEVFRFSLTNQVISKELIWEDWTVEQGEKYIYALQQYNSQGLYTNRLKASNQKILSDFEDCFISDKDRQLKIRFNAKVSSLKNNVLETKIYTIGIKDPFIFKNGYTHYKEFPISGLLSMISDENGKFNYKYKKTEQMSSRLAAPGFNMSQSNDTDLIAENIYKERQFKIEVLEWLNNGEPKIFRSPTEGCYIVKIMNVSLTPNEQVGRMLHTLNCTAYEISDWDFINLNKNNLLPKIEIKSNSLQMGQVVPRIMANASNFSQQYPLFSINLTKTFITFPNSYNVNIEDATPGTKFKLHFLNGDSPVVLINKSGKYTVSCATDINDENNAFTGIELVSGNWGETKVSFEYYNYAFTDYFEYVKNISIHSTMRQFIGNDYNINLVSGVNTNTLTKSLINSIEDIRTDAGMCYSLQVKKKLIQPIWWKAEGRYTRDATLLDEIKDSEWNAATIYHLQNTINKGYYDGHYTNRIKGDIIDYRFCLNNININYSNYSQKETEELDTLYDIDRLNVLRIGNGLLVDLAYEEKIISYTIEDTNVGVQSAKNAWSSARNSFIQFLQGRAIGVTLNETNIKIKRNELYTKYEQYINLLTNALDNV